MIALALLLLSLSAAAGETDAESAAARIDAYVEPLVAADQISGELLVARGEEVVYRRRFGRANFELDVPVTSTTRFNVASLTKPMTQIIALRLAEAGVLNASDPLSKWIAGFPRGEDITLEHLLTHRAGFVHRVTTPQEESMPLDTADIVERAKTTELLFEPGTQEGYSSVGYTVLTRVLELASGKPYATLLEEHVTRPAGALRTLHPQGATLIPERADSYFHGAAGPINAHLKHLQFLAGAGSVYSTAGDLLRIVRHIVDEDYGALVKRNLVRENGIRWNGITNGWRTFADYRPDSNVTVIFTGNYFTGAGDLLRSNVHRIADGESIQPPSVPRVELAAMGATERAAIEGLFELRPGSEQPVEFTGNIIRFGEWVLIPIGSDSLFSPQDYAVVTIERNTDGRATALQWGEGPRFARVGDLPDQAN